MPLPMKRRLVMWAFDNKEPVTYGILRALDRFLDDEGYDTDYARPWLRRYKSDYRKGLKENA